MPPTLAELLEVAQQHDAVIHSRHVKINKAMRDAGEIVVTAGIPVHELHLSVEEDADPFQGNLNNRRVAARIARQIDPHKSANHSDPFIVGNPAKAAEDVAKSLAVLPEPAVPSGDDIPASMDLLPSPGSPKAQRLTKAQQKAADKAAADAAAATTAAAPAAAVAPPTWDKATDATS